MIKFTASDKWYKLAAQSEIDVLDISAGHPHLSAHDARGPLSLRTNNLHKIRRQEGFSTLLRQLRVKKGLSVEELAKKLDIDIEEILLLEIQAGYKATPRALIALADFYKISSRIFLQIGGAIQIDPKMEQEMIRYAAESETFEKLTSSEKKLLDRTIKIISESNE